MLRWILMSALFIRRSQLHWLMLVHIGRFHDKTNIKQKQYSEKTDVATLKGSALGCWALEGLVTSVVCFLIDGASVGYLLHSWTIWSFSRWWIYSTSLGLFESHASAGGRIVAIGDWITTWVWINHISACAKLEGLCYSSHQVKPVISLQIDFFLFQCSTLRSWSSLLTLRSLRCAQVEECWVYLRSWTSRHNVSRSHRKERSLVFLFHQSFHECWDDLLHAWILKLTAGQQGQCKVKVNAK